MLQAFIGDGNGLTNLSGFTGAGDGTEAIPGISFFQDQDNGFIVPVLIKWVFA